MKIPFYEPCIGEEEARAVQRVLKSKWLTQGPEVEAFEAEAAAILGTPFDHECVAVSSCTAALYLLLKQPGFCDGTSHGVHVPALTFAATANAVIAAGLNPVLSDVDDDGYLAEWGDKNVAVTFAGVMRERRSGNTIFDQAHSFQPGAFKPNSAWSFYSNKNIGCGEGGLVGCDKETAQKIRAMRSHGRVGKYDVGFAGSLNFRMTEIQAAILREQIKKLPWIIAKKKGLADVYKERLRGVKGLMLAPNGVTHLYWIRVDNRDGLMNHLREASIETSIHYKPLHQMEAFKEYGRKQGYLMADKIASKTLSLPFWPGLKEVQAHFICDEIRAFCSE